PRAPAAPPPPPPGEDIYGLDEEELAPSVVDNAYTPPKAALVDEDESPAVRRVGVKKGKKRRRQPAGLGRRWAALILDNLILSGINFAIGFVAGIALASAGVNVNTLPVMIGLNGFSLVLVVLYFAAQHSSESQATIGKRALGLKVTDLDGQPLS